MSAEEQEANERNVMKTPLIDEEKLAGFDAKKTKISNLLVD